MRFEEILPIADKIIEKLSTWCEPQKCKIAGSIRRLKKECKDIEICAIPTPMEINDLFGEHLKKMVNQDFDSIVKSLGVVEKGKTDGRYMQIRLPGNVMLDLFLPQPDDFWRQYAIRTGSSEFSQKVIAAGWRKLGWVGTDKGLRKAVDCYGQENSQGKIVWQVVNNLGEKPPVWKSEEEFFEWLGIKFVEPQHRI